MCDGDFGGGYGDPDYYDLEFREQNPSIYGHDEYMQDLDGSAGNAYQNGQTANGYNYQTKNKGQFSEEYLKWKRDHPDRVAFFQSKPYKPKTENSTAAALGIAIYLIILTVLAILFIDGCT